MVKSEQIELLSWVLQEVLQEQKGEESVAADQTRGDDGRKSKDGFGEFCLIHMDERCFSMSYQDPYSTSLAKQILP